MTHELVTVTVPVAWGDMDAFGHVNNVVYFRWFETGRIALFLEAGIPHRDVGQSHGPILANTQCNFMAPLAFPDVVSVRTTVKRVGGKSFTLAYEVHSEGLDAIAASGDSVVVWYDYTTAKAAPLDDALRKQLGRWQVAS